MNRPLHVAALLVAVATFPLIFMGGLVTSKGVGLSVPDWPNSYGYNMFTFPVSKWQGGIFFEHTHRLMASLVGMLSIALVIVAWISEERPWVRWCSLAVLGMVILQGVLGGLRVILVNLDLAIVHACVAQAFFCLAVIYCIFTSDWWREAPHLSGMGRGKGLIPLGLLCVLTIYTQLMIGATMRHFRAGLAIPDILSVFGRWVPPMDSTDLAADNVKLAAAGLPQVSLGQIWLAYLHRIGACIVTLEVVSLIAVVLVRYRDQIKLLVPAIILAALLAVQLTLGILTVLWRKPADIASLHVACGALVLATTVLLTVRAMRLYVHPFWHERRHRNWPNKTKIGFNVVEGASA